MWNSLDGMGALVCRYLLIASLSAVGLVALAWVVIRLGRVRAAVYRHSIWLYCLAGMVVVPALWMYAPKLKLAILPPSAPALPAGIELPEWTPPARSTLPAAPVTVGPAAAPTVAAPAPAPVLPASRAPVVSVRGVIAALWVAGVAFMLLRLGVGGVRLRRICRNARPMDTAQPHSAVDAVAVPAPEPRLLVTSDLASPVCCGVLSPVILLPEELVDGDDPARLRMALNHELAHVRRRDIAANALQRLVEALFFFHPLVWYASRLLTQERERICDNWVVEQGADAGRYAEFLADLAQGKARRPRLVGVALCENGLLGRVKDLLDPRRARLTRLSRWAALACAVGAMAAFGVFGVLRLSRAEDAGTDVPWGPPAAGVQLRLTAEKSEWGNGESPAFRINMRIVAKQDVDFARNWTYEPVIDGIRYQAFGVKYVAVSGPWQLRTEWPSSRMVLDSTWGLRDSGMRLVLAPGEHTISVVAKPHGGWDGDGTFKLMSNPVRFTVVEAPAHEAGPARMDSPASSFDAFMALAAWREIRSRFRAGEFDRAVALAREWREKTAGEGASVIQGTGIDFGAEVERAMSPERRLCVLLALPATGLSFKAVPFRDFVAELQRRLGKDYEVRVAPGTETPSSVTVAAGGAESIGAALHAVLNGTAMGFVINGNALILCRAARGGDLSLRQYDVNDLLFTLPGNRQDCNTAFLAELRRLTGGYVWSAMLTTAPTPGQHDAVGTCRMRQGYLMVNHQVWAHLLVEDVLTEMRTASLKQQVEVKARFIDLPLATLNELVAAGKVGLTEPSAEERAKGAAVTGLVRHAVSDLWMETCLSRDDATTFSAPNLTVIDGEQHFTAVLSEKFNQFVPGVKDGRVVMSKETAQRETSVVDVGISIKHEVARPAYACHFDVKISRKVGSGKGTPDEAPVLHTQSAMFDMSVPTARTLLVVLPPPWQKEKGAAPTKATIALIRLTPLALGLEVAAPVKAVPVRVDPPRTEEEYRELVRVAIWRALPEEVRSAGTKFLDDKQRTEMASARLVCVDGAAKAVAAADAGTPGGQRAPSLFLVFEASCPARFEVDMLVKRIPEALMDVALAGFKPPIVRRILVCEPLQRRVKNSTTGKDDNILFSSVCVETTGYEEFVREVKEGSRQGAAAPGTETQPKGDVARVSYADVLALYPDADKLRMPTEGEIKAMGTLWPGVAAGENGAYLLLNAGRQCSTDLGAIPPGSASTESSYAGDKAAFDRWIGANQVVLDGLRRSLGAKEWQWPLFMRKQSNTPTCLLAVWSVMSMAHLATDAGFARELAGDPDAAADWYLAPVQLGRKVRQGATRWTAAEGCGNTSLGCEHLDRLISSGKLSEAELLRIIAECRAAEVAEDEVAAIVRRERMVLRVMAAAIRDEASWADYCEYVGAQIRMPSVMPDPVCPPMPRDLPGFRRRVDAFMAEVERYYQRPLLAAYSERDRFVDSLPGDVGGLAPALWNGKTGYSGLAGLALSMNAELRATQLRAAISLFAARNAGRVPEALDDLAPGILERVPADPFSGRPFRFAQTPDGWKLWSVSWNLRDDGGLALFPGKPRHVLSPDCVSYSTLPSNTAARSGKYPHAGHPVVIKPGAASAPGPWGEAIDGWRCRIRPERTAWAVGEAPQFKLDVCNAGPDRRMMDISSLRLGVGGKWYEWDTDFSGCESAGLANGEQQVDIRVRIPPKEWLEVESRQPLTLSEGRHTVRVRIASRSGRAYGGAGPVAESNAVEIVVGGGQEQPPHTDEAYRARPLASAAAAQTVPPEKPTAAPSTKRSVSVKGRVVDEKDRPVKGAEVSAWPWSRSAGERVCGAKGVSDSDGRFAFESLQVEADQRGAWACEVRASKQGYALASLPPVERTGPADQITLHLLPPTTFSVRVCDREGRPISGASVKGDFFRRMTGRNSDVMYLVMSTAGAAEGALTDRNGFCRFDNVPAGCECRLTVTAAGYGMLGTNNYREAGGALDAFKVDAGKTEVRLGPESRIEGTVLIAGGRTPTGMRVNAAEIQQAAHTSVMKVGADGRFVVRGIPAGTYNVAVMGDDRHEYRSRAVEVTVGEGEVKEGVQLRVEEGVRVTGRVVDQAGAPMVDAYVGLYELDGGACTQTNAVGEYALTLLPGSYRAQSNARDGRSVVRYPEVVPEGVREVRLKDLTAQPGTSSRLGLPSFLLLDEAGKPVAQCKATWRGRSLGRPSREDGCLEIWRFLYKSMFAEGEGIRFVSPGGELAALWVPTDKDFDNWDERKQVVLTKAAVKSTGTEGTAYPRTEEEYRARLLVSAATAVPRNVRAEGFRIESAPFPDDSSRAAAAARKRVASNGGLVLTFTARCKAGDEKETLTVALPRAMEMVAVRPQVSAVVRGEVMVSDPVLRKASLDGGAPQPVLESNVHIPVVGFAMYSEGLRSLPGVRSRSTPPKPSPGAQEFAVVAHVVRLPASALDKFAQGNQVRFMAPTKGEGGESAPAMALVPKAVAGAFVEEIRRAPDMTLVSSPHATVYDGQENVMEWGPQAAYGNGWTTALTLMPTRDAAGEGCRLRFKYEAKEEVEEGKSGATGTPTPQRWGVSGTATVPEAQALLVLMPGTTRTDARKQRGAELEAVFFTVTAVPKKASAEPGNGIVVVVEYVEFDAELKKRFPPMGPVAAFDPIDFGNRALARAAVTVGSGGTGKVELRIPESAGAGKGERVSLVRAELSPRVEGTGEFVMLDLGFETVTVAVRNDTALSRTSAMKTTVRVPMGKMLALGGAAILQSMPSAAGGGWGLFVQVRRAGEPGGEARAAVDGIQRRADQEIGGPGKGVGPQPGAAVPQTTYADMLAMYPYATNLRLPTAEEMKKLGALWPSVPPEENAAYWFDRAAVQVKYVGEPMGSLSGATPYAGDRVGFGAWVRDNAPALESLKRGLALRVCQRPPFVDTAKGSVSPMFPHLAALRQLARTVADAGFNEELNARSEAAVEWYMADIRMGAQMRRGTLISSLIGTAICAMGESPLSGVVANADLPAPTLKRIIEVARACETSLDEVRSILPHELALLNGGEDSASLAALYKEVQRSQGMSLPVYLSDPVTQRLRNDRGEDSATKGASWVHCRVQLGRLDASMRALQIRAAIALFRKGHGRLPETLAELVPEYLPAVPEDPFDAKPMRYARTGAIWKVWSVGPDQKDDGGTVVEGKIGFSWAGPDYVFISNLPSSLERRAAWKQETMWLPKEAVSPAAGNDPMGLTPLHYAANRGDAAEVARLLKEGADVKAKGKCGQTPLHLAATAEAVELLLQGGADPVAKSLAAPPITTPLEWAVLGDRREAAERLWRTAAVQKDANYSASVDQAVRLGRDEMALLFIRLGASPRAVMHSAAREGNGGLVERLLSMGVALDSSDAVAALEQCDLDMLDFCLAHGVQADIYTAVGLGRAKEVRQFLADDPSLIRKPGPMGRPPLLWAVATGQRAMVALLIEAGADVNARAAGVTPLHEAARIVFDWRRGTSPLGLRKTLWVSIVGYGGRPVDPAGTFEELLARGADVNAVDDSGFTPLMCAAQSANSAAVDLLLRKGADRGIKDKTGKTALDYAERTGFGEMVRLLKGER